MTPCNRRPGRAVPAAALLCLLAACGSGELVASAGAERAPPSGARAREHPAQLPWSADPAVERVVLALEDGRLGDARGALAALGPAGPGQDGAALERSLLRARLRAAEGDPVGAVAEIESARARFGDQGRVYATAAELHATAGRLESAEDEVRAGLLAAGPCAALGRARGVLALSRPGGARTALEHLLAARAEEPGLPFCDRPLAQAHVLLGRRSIGEERVLEALGHAQAALSARAGDRDALELLAEAQTQSGDYDGAVATYEVLLAAGEDVVAILAVTCQRGSTAALLAGERSVALQRALRARELGLSDEELGFGATLIEEEAERALDRGVAHFAEGQHDLARAAFELAVGCRPASLEANNHLAVALMALGDAAGAARHWRKVVAEAAADELELPEPVHVRLALALEAAGRPEESRQILEAYLAATPDGRWAPETRAALQSR